MRGYGGINSPEKNTCSLGNTEKGGDISIFFSSFYPLLRNLRKGEK